MDDLTTLADAFRMHPGAPPIRFDPTALMLGLVPGSDEVHVRPVGDLVDHSLDDQCPCGPRWEPVKREDGSVGWVVVHHSLDGREVHA